MIDQESILVQAEHISKEYRIGELDVRTFQEEWKNWWSGKKRTERKKEKNRLEALSDVSLSVGRGEVLGIIGKNGAGKSTLLKIISRVTAPSAGKVALYGTVTSLLEVGCGFHPELTGRENIFLNGSILGMKRAEIQNKLDEIIEFAEIGELIDTPVKRYSSGMYVKLAFSVATFLAGDILILDEILAVGDMSFQKKCLKKMKETVNDRNSCILYVSHNVATVQSLCSRCILLDHGKIIYDGDVDRAVALYLGSGFSNRVSYKYDASFRPYDQFIRIHPRLEIMELQIVEDNGAVFSAEEKQHLLIRCLAKETMTDVCLRFELWFEDGIKVGTMLSGKGILINKGENWIEAEMDPEHLTNGQYTADLVAYQYDEDGSEDILDGVYPGLVFQIRNSHNSKHYLDWHYRYWGAVRLHDLTVAKAKGMGSHEQSG